MIQLTDEPIDATRLLQRVSSPDAGAVVLFLGTTRQWTDQRETVALDYECYREMAEKKLSQMASAAQEKWEITQSAIVHRLGRVNVGDVSVAIAVSAPHRQNAFEAGRWLIDTVKKEVPIWKKENWADGTSEWVHPHPVSSPPGDTSQS